MVVLVVDASLIRPSPPKPTSKTTLGYPSHICWQVAYRSRILFFRSADISTDSMKASLSQTLSYYYPLAGRLIVNENDSTMELDANNAGVMFVEATSDEVVREEDGIENSIVEQLSQVPGFEGRLQWPWPSDAPLVFIQLTWFNDGSFSLAVKYSHQALDGTAVWNFFKSWAEVSRGQPLSMPPQIIDWPISRKRIVLSDQFKVPYHFQPVSKGVSYAGKLSRKQFTFSHDMINELKAENPGFSTFQLLSSYLWCKVTQARGLKFDEAAGLVFAVNWRGKVKELSKTFLGGAATVASSVANAGLLCVSAAGIQHGAKLIKKTVESFDPDVDRAMVDSGEHSKYTPSINCGKDLFIAASFYFPVYEEYSWGRPNGLAAEQSPIDGHVYYFPGKSTRSVDVFISLASEAMDNLVALLTQ